MEIMTTLLLMLAGWIQESGRKIMQETVAKAG
jgi:hypothetical protein